MRQRLLAWTMALLYSVQAHPSWANESTGYGARRFDDLKQIEGLETGFEGNTTPWSRMSQQKFNHKMDQLAADFALLKEKKIQRVIWFGREPFPSTGLGSKLGRTFEEMRTNGANIEYQVIP